MKTQIFVRGAARRSAADRFRSAVASTGTRASSLRNTRMDTDSNFGDNYMKLEKPYLPRNLTVIDRIPDGTKRCRICQEAKPLAEFRTLTNKGKSWPYYACNPCSLELQRQYYQRRRTKLPVAEEFGKRETGEYHGNP